MFTLRKIFAFIKKDFLVQASYRFAFIFSWLSILITVTTLYFIAKLIDQGPTPYLKEYQTGYFPFVLIGIAFSGYLSTAMHSFSVNTRQEQVIGTLESILLTPTKIPVIIISLFFWDFIFNSVTAVVYLLFGVLFFKLDLSHMNLPNAIVILLLTIIYLSSIGIISASFIMIFKRGDPINWLIATLSVLFGGIFFPVEMLPGALRVISYFFPITYSLRALRYALLKGYGFKMLVSDIGILLFFCIILLPLSIWMFEYSVKKAKSDGSLSHY